LISAATRTWEFCRLAQREGLKVIVRPGPYVCGQWDFGGLPWWLLKEPNLRIRIGPLLNLPTGRAEYLARFL
jgi:beta-galactosidase GanA